MRLGMKAMVAVANTLPSCCKHCKQNKTSLSNSGSNAFYHSGWTCYLESLNISTQSSFNYFFLVALNLFHQELDRQDILGFIHYRGFSTRYRLYTLDGCQLSSVEKCTISAARDLNCLLLAIQPPVRCMCPLYLYINEIYLAIYQNALRDMVRVKYNNCQ